MTEVTLAGLDFSGGCGDGSNSGGEDSEGGEELHDDVGGK